MSIRIIRGKNNGRSDVQSEIKNIHEQRINSLPIGSSIPYIYEYTPFREEELSDNFFCALGSRWYMTFRVFENEVNIEFLMDDGSNDKFRQICELKSLMYALLMVFKDRYFTAYCNSNSRPILKSFAKRGFIELDSIDDSVDETREYITFKWKVTEKFSDTHRDTDTSITLKSFSIKEKKRRGILSKKK